MEIHKMKIRDDSRASVMIPWNIEQLYREYTKNPYTIKHLDKSSTWKEKNNHYLVVTAVSFNLLYLINKCKWNIKLFLKGKNLFV
jgi:hypothetical protein